MTSGISTYALFWQWPSCDYPLIESFDDVELAALRTHAEGLGVALELGIRGVSPEHLGRYLDLAQALDVTPGGRAGDADQHHRADRAVRAQSARQGFRVQPPGRMGRLHLRGLPARRRAARLRRPDQHRPAARAGNQPDHRTLVALAGDNATTCRLEDQWTRKSLHYLRSKQA